MVFLFKIELEDFYKIAYNMFFTVETSPKKPEGLTRMALERAVRRRSRRLAEQVLRRKKSGK